MSETWEQTKARFRKQGVDLRTDIVVVEPPGARYAEPKTEVPVKRFNIHKRSLPVGIDKIVVIGVAKEEAEWLVENKLKTRCYENGPDESKTLVFFDVIPVDATPRERSIYFNPPETRRVK